MSGHAIDARGVTLARGDRVVVSDVDLAIAPGEFIGVFGPNGSGKTTFVHALLGLIKPTTGRLEIDGKEPSRGSSSIGFLPQQRATVGDLRLRARDFVAAARNGQQWGLPLHARSDWDEVDAVLDEVDARLLASRYVCELSGGELQRLFLAQAMLGSPRLLLLDEPLQALDPHFQVATVTLVKEIQKRRQVTVVFTAHDVNALLGAMDRVLYFGGGKAVLGTIDQVINGRVLSEIYATPIEVVEVDHHIIVLTERGVIESGHDHHHA